MKKIFILVAAVVALFAGGAWLSNILSSRNPDVLATNGIHWHPQLEIYIQGEKQEIPANLGLSVGHSPIHTHEDMPIIHLEFGGIVTKDDVRLGRFFDVWGRTFNEECILEFCNGPAGEVKMFVNGKENTQFDDYIMRDKDAIQIRYE